MSRSDTIDSATTEDGIEPVCKSDIKMDELTISDSPSSAETINKGEISTGEEVIKTDESTNSSDSSAEDDSKSCGKQLVKEDGSLNWDIPCFGMFRDTPCWEDFKTAFACIHFSENPDAPMECMDKHELFMECVEKHPNVFPPPDD